MNKYYFMPVALALFISSCSSRSISRDKVPSIALNTFEAQYPSSADVEWEKHGNVYEAEFDVNDSMEVAARIDEAGNLVMQKQDLAINEVDPRVLKTLQNQFKEYQIDDVEKIQKKGIVYYQVELNAKMKKDINIVFSVDGREEKSIPYWD